MWQGFIRFQIDVLLILLYGVLLLLFRHIDWALGIGTFIYLLYAVWDLLEASEYKRQNVRDRLVSAAGFGLIALLWAGTWYFSPPVVWAATAAIALNFLYRIVKIKWATEQDERLNWDGRKSTPISP
jgi:hypothetical protein